MEIANLNYESTDLLTDIKPRLDDSSLDEEGLPYTTLSYAQTIDGSISTRERRPMRISNEQSLRLTHQLRAIHDAILVGIETVLIDDPRLTVRFADGDDPQSVVVDSRLRFPLNARLLKNRRLPIIATRSDCCPETQQRLVDAGATVVYLPLNEQGMLDLRYLARQLKRRGFNSLLVEGGARIITSVLQERLADQLVLTISPMFVDGWRAVHHNQDDFRPTLKLTNLQFQQLDGDLIIRGDFPRKN